MRFSTGRTGDGNGREGGFTLIEFIVVLVIVGLLAGAIVPQFAGTHRDEILRSAARELVQVARLASSHAVSTNRTCRLRFDAAGSRYVLEARKTDPSEGGFEPLDDVPGANGRLDRRVRLRLRPSREGRDQSSEVRPDAEPRQDVEAISFHTDGTAEPCEILLEVEDGDALVLRIQRTTSRVRVVPLEEALQSAVAPLPPGR